MIPRDSLAAHPHLARRVCDAQRALLFDMDNAIQRLNATAADELAGRNLVGCPAVA